MNIRKTVFAFFIIILSPASTGKAYAYGLPQKVRVGLESSYKNASTIPIGNKEVQIGYESNSSFVLSAVISTTGAFSAVPANMYYVRAEGFFYDYAQARGSAENYRNSGYNACAALLDDNYFAVYLGGYQNEAEAASVRNSLSAGAAVLNPANCRTALAEDGYALIIFDNANKNGQISASKTVSLGNRSYRGIIELCRNNSQSLTAVNVLTPDEYLYGVVASEMPSGWHIEALKAQAVASRSYAATRAGAHADSNYHFCDGVHCQLYIGAGSESESSVRAVSETSGIMAYYVNEPINAVYFSSSGGATADSETVWSDTVPYLRSVQDKNEKTAKEWQRSFTLSEITSMLNSKGYNIGQAVSVSIGEASACGRVDRLDITGTNGMKSLEKEEIRTFFSASEGGSLESRMFEIGSDFVPVADATKGRGSVFVQNAEGAGEFDIGSLYAYFQEGLPSIRLSGALSAISIDSVSDLSTVTAKSVPIRGGSSSSDTIVFTGRGYGHGVGMSQHGANGMAEAGYTYREILSHYYTGIEIR